MPHWETVVTASQKRRRHWRLAKLTRCQRCNGKAEYRTARGTIVPCGACKGTGKQPLSDPVALPSPKTVTIRRDRPDDDLPF